MAVKDIGDTGMPGLKDLVQASEEVLAEQEFADLKGKNVGVVVNHTSVDQQGNHFIQLAYDTGIKILFYLKEPIHYYY